MKQRDFIAVYGPGLMSKPAVLQTHRAKIILSQVSNWRCVVNTDGGVSVLSIPAPSLPYARLARD
jgi:hypothetical protein